MINSINLSSAQGRIILPPTITIDDIVKTQTATSPSICPNEKPFPVNGVCIQCEAPNILYNFTSQ